MKASTDPCVRLAMERATVCAAGSTHEAVRELCLEVGRGEILALVGPNGSGKSTTLAALAGVLPPVRGRVWLDGKEIGRYRRRELARRMARLPQEPGCPEGVTVEQVARFGRHPHASAVRGRDAGAAEAVERALDGVGLLEMRKRPLQSLSGGERRRAWLAMVLAQQSEIVLLDEPTAALDLRHQLEVLEIVRELAPRCTVVLVLHDLGQAAQVSDRVAILHRGRLYRSGPARECIDERALREVFGVRGELYGTPHDMRLAVHGLATPRRRFERTPPDAGP